MEQGKIVIAFIIDRLAGSDGMTGGTERQLIEMANRLMGNICLPIVISLRDNPDSEVWQSLRCEKHILHVQSLASPDGIKKLLGLSRLLKRRSIDIVQTFFFDATIFGVLAARLGGVGTVISSRRDMGFWYDKKKISLLRLINLFSNRIITNSFKVRDMVVRYEKVPLRRIDVINNGIDFETFATTPAAPLYEEFPQLKDNSLLVGIVANLNRTVKRVDLFIKVAGKVLQDNPDCRFLIIGDGKLRPELQDLVRTLNIDEAVFFLGSRSPALPYIKYFCIGMLTSDSEGFPNALLEYMAMGVPVVATAVGGVTELIQDGKTGLLAPVGDYRTLAKQVNILLGNEKKRKTIGENGKILVRKQFNWTHKILEFEAYYRKLLRS